MQTSDGGYALAGCTMSYGVSSFNMWLVKTDMAGNAQWNKTYGGEGIASCVLQTIDAGYLLLGTTRAFGAGGADIWLVKTDSAGNMQWNKTYGGGNDDYGGCGAVQTSDGGYAITGALDHAGFYYDSWLAKTDATGNVQWSKTYGGSSLDALYGLIQTNDGGYAMAGTTWSFGAGSCDGWLVKTDADGNMQWNKTFGGADLDYVGNILVQTSDGGYALTGWTLSFGAGDFDIWLIKLAPERIPRAMIDIDPDALNSKSMGRWMTAYIQLPEGYSAADINATTILLNGTIQPVLDSKYDFVINSSEYLVDHNNDGIIERMVKFNRTEVESFIRSQGIGWGKVQLTVTG